MDTVDIRKSLLNEVATIIDNDELVVKALKSIRRLKAAADNQEKLSAYTTEELESRIDEYLADDAAGRVYTTEQAANIIERKYPFLCK